ncbi:hypothetical protein N9251_02795 [Gammaproteobacteria bacterium]|nr:hypothetical protein [Gammaproteobacteria bacterium]
MRKLITNTFIFTIPFVILFFIYFIADPFHLFRYRTQDSIAPTVNRAYSGIMSFNRNNKDSNFNSFIIGSSRSFMFHTSDWKKHLTSKSKCFHFDQSGQNLFGMVKQLEWLDANVSDSISNLLLIMDIESLNDVSAKKGVVYENPPQIMNNDNFLAFHINNIKAFYKPKFIIPYFDLIINKTWKSYMSKGGFVKGVYTNYYTNDFYWLERDSLINEGNYYVNHHFYNRKNNQETSDTIITTEQEVLLLKIKEISDRNKTKLKIVIGPLYNQIKMNSIDKHKLELIFGDRVVYDYSGINSFTENIHNFYETSHYKSSVCISIMDSIYIDK